MTTVLVWAVIVSFAVGWFVHLIAPDKGAVIWIRCAAISAFLVLATGLVGVLGWGAALLRWLRH